MCSVRYRTLKRIDHAGDARYLTFSCYRRLPLLTNDRIKDVFVDELTHVHQELKFRLLAWVVMPEHVHLLVIPDEVDVDKLLRKLKAPFARRVLNRWRKLHAPVLARLTDAQGCSRFWQHGGGYDRNVVSEHVLRQTVEYTHANPVRRGLVNGVTDWRWSSARWYAGEHDSTPIIDPWET